MLGSRLHAENPLLPLAQLLPVLRQVHIQATLLHDYGLVCCLVSVESSVLCVVCEVAVFASHVRNCYSLLDLLQKIRHK